jgi:hypothetical protein
MSIVAHHRGRMYLYWRLRNNWISLAWILRLLRKLHGRLNKFEATIKNIIELELRLANLNRWVVITEILKQEVVHKLAIKVKFEATHTLAIEQAIHIVNLGMVTFLVILAIFKLLNFVSLC